MGKIKSAIWECVKAALVYTVFCLFAMAVLAAVVKSCSPSDTAVSIARWALKCVGTFLFCVIFIKKDRALFKGMAAGLLGAFLAMFAFAAIGGGFHLNVFFLLELLVCVILGGLGGLVGAKLRKDR